MRVLSRPGWAGDVTMRRIRHADEQIIRKLKTPEQLIAQARTLPMSAVPSRAPSRPITAGSSSTTGCKRGGQAEPQLEKEKARFKKLLAEAELEKVMLKELAEGNF